MKLLESLIALLGLWAGSDVALTHQSFELSHPTGDLFGENQVIDSKLFAFTDRYIVVDGWSSVHVFKQADGTYLDTFPLEPEWWIANLTTIPDQDLIVFSRLRRTAAGAIDQGMTVIDIEGLVPDEKEAAARSFPVYDMRKENEKEVSFLGLFTLEDGRLVASVWSGTKRIVELREIELIFSKATITSEGMKRPPGFVIEYPGPPIYMRPFAYASPIHRDRQIYLSGSLSDELYLIFAVEPVAHIIRPGELPRSKPLELPGFGDVTTADRTGEITGGRITGLRTSGDWHEVFYKGPNGTHHESVMLNLDWNPSPARAKESSQMGFFVGSHNGIDYFYSTRDRRHILSW